MEMDEITKIGQSGIIESIVSADVLKRIYEEKNITDAEKLKSVRKIISIWSNSLPNHELTDLGDKVEILSVMEKPSYLITFQTQYERRELEDKIRPYKGESIPQKSITQKSDIDIWSINIPPVDDFTDAEKECIVNDSQEILKCEQCHSQGEITCQSCNGSGIKTCLFCSGRGEVKCSSCGGSGEHKCNLCCGSGQRDESIGNGRYRKLNCYACGGRGYNACKECRHGWNNCVICGSSGNVTCGKCNGFRKLRCPFCDGYKEVISFFNVRIFFKTTTKTELINYSKLPSEIVSGENIYICSDSEKLVSCKNCKVKNKEGRVICRSCGSELHEGEEKNDDNVKDRFESHEDKIKNSTDEKLIETHMMVMESLTLSSFFVELLSKECSETMFVNSYLNHLEKIKDSREVIFLIKEMVARKLINLELAFLYLLLTKIDKESKVGFLLRGMLLLPSGNTAKAIDTFKEGSKKENKGSRANLKKFKLNATLPEDEEYLESLLRSFNGSYSNGYEFVIDLKKIPVCDAIGEEKGELIVDILQKEEIPANIFELVDHAPLKMATSRLIASSKELSELGILGKDYRILKQRQSLNKINVINVEYKFLTREYQIWIYGKDKVFVPASPIFEIAEGYFEKGQVAFKSKGYTLALDLVDKALSINPKKEVLKSFKKKILTKIENQYIWGGVIGGGLTGFVTALVLTFIDMHKVGFHVRTKKDFILGSVAFAISPLVGFIVGTIFRYSLSTKVMEDRKRFPYAFLTSAVSVLVIVIICGWYLL